MLKKRGDGMGIWIGEDTKFGGDFTQKIFTQRDLERERGRT